jgi:hypothetical protein
MQKNNVKKNNNGFRNIIIGILILYAVSVFLSILDFDSDYFQYENEDEIPLLQRVPGNDVATSGDFAKSFDIFDQEREYPNVDFLRDSVNNFYMRGDNDKYYFFILNTVKQCFDIVSTNTVIDDIGKSGDEKRYNTLIRYRDIFIAQYGEEYYNREVETMLPYDITIPIYNHHTIYGQNLSS